MTYSREIFFTLKAFVVIYFMVDIIGLLDENKEVSVANPGEVLVELSLHEYKDHQNLVDSLVSAQQATLLALTDQVALSVKQGSAKGLFNELNPPMPFWWKWVEISMVIFIVISFPFLFKRLIVEN